MTAGPGPDFRELVGEDLPAEERERLERVHALLLSAGAPPELPPGLQRPPEPPAPARIFPLPRRRLRTALVLAAALALALFGAGYFVGHHGRGFPTEFTLPMHGTQAAPVALASIRVGNVDKAGNWPLEMRVRGLKPLAVGGYYELFLTKGHKPVVSCGTFTVHEGITTVRLNAPYTLRHYDGWVVMRHLPGEGDGGPVLLTT